MSFDIRLDEHIHTIHDIVEQQHKQHKQQQYNTTNDIIDLTTELPPLFTVCNKQLLQQSLNYNIQYDRTIFNHIGLVNVSLNTEYFKLSANNDQDKNNQQEQQYISQYAKHTLALLDTLYNVQQQCNNDKNYTQSTYDIVTTQLSIIIKRIVQQYASHNKSDITSLCIIYSDLCHIKDRLKQYNICNKLYNNIIQQLRYIEHITNDCIHNWLDDNWSVIIQQTNYKFIQQHVDQIDINSMLNSNNNTNIPIVDIVKNYVLTMSKQYNNKLHSSIQQCPLLHVTITIIHSFIQYVLANIKQINVQCIIQLKYITTNVITVLLYKWNNTFQMKHNELTKTLQINETTDSTYYELLNNIQYIYSILYVMLHTELFNNQDINVGCLSLNDIGNNNSNRVVPMPNNHIINTVNSTLTQEQTQQCISIVSHKFKDKVDRKLISDTLY